MHRMESFSRNGVGVDNKEVISTRRERIVSGQVIFFGGGAVECRGLIQIPSLVLTKKSRLIGLCLSQERLKLQLG